PIVLLLSLHAALPIAPVHCSAMSHSPAAGRHTVVAGLKPSAGHSLCTPSQRSSSSQGPAADRHSAVLLASAGQSGPAPVHCSARSGEHTSELQSRVEL